MSDCWSSHHREPAMDDSIDAESFCNGSFSIVSNSGQKKTHGSHISSNASRATSGTSTGHPMTGSKLGSPFVTPAKPVSQHETGRSTTTVHEALRHLNIDHKLEDIEHTILPAILGRARQDRPGAVTEKAISTIRDAVHGGAGGTGSFVEVMGGPPPSVASHAYTGRTGRSEGDSGVLVGDCESRPLTAQQRHGEASIFYGNSPPLSGKWLRRAPVAYEGSPIPRAMKNHLSDWRLVPSAPGESAGADDHQNLNIWARSPEMEDAGFGLNGNPHPWISSSFQGSPYQTSKSELQAHCRTATPGQSEIDGVRMRQCSGCWGGCDECCRPWSTGEHGHEAWSRDEQLSSSERVSRARVSCIAGSVPTAVVATARTDHACPVPSQQHGTAGIKSVAPGLSQDSGTTSFEQHTPAKVLALARHAVLDSEHRRPDHQGRMASRLEEEDEMLAPRLISYCTGKADVEKGLGNLEQRVFEKLDKLEKKVSETGHGTHPAAQVGSEMKSVASITVGNGPGHGASRTDLDLRDLNKQVLKMSLYEKFKRERDLTDRLARIEEKLTTKSTPTGHAMGPTSNPQDIENLRYQIIQQRHEIGNLKQELGLMPDVRGELANLSNEALWTRDRINNLENIACQQERDIQDGLQNRMYEAHQAMGNPFPPPAVQYSKAGSCQPTQSNGWAAQAYGESENIREEDVGGWGREASPPPQSDIRFPQRTESGWGPRRKGSYEDESVPRARGWGEASSVVHPFGTPYARSGGGWAGSCRTRSYQEGFSVADDASAYQPSDMRSKASTIGDTEDGFFSHHEPSRSGGWGRSGGGASSVPSTNRMFEAHASFGLGGASGARSFDNRSRAPTVETILDEDEFKPFASRTYDSGTSWAMVSSRPQTGTDQTSFQTLERPSAGSSNWTQISSRPNSQGPDSESSSNSSVRPTNAHGEVNCGRYEPRAATWEGVNPSWFSHRGGSQASNKQSRDHWRRPTTPSKFEGETGLGSGGAWDKASWWK